VNKLIAWSILVLVLVTGWIPLARSEARDTRGDMTAYSLIELHKRLASGKLTSESLVEQYLAAIELQQQYNAFITIDAESALAVARQRDKQRSDGELLGQLHGIPFAIKDNIHVAAMLNTAGTRALQSFVPDKDAGVVARLRRAGAIIIGKNNLHELAYGTTSNNYAYGAVGNAYNLEYFAGGSSGGTAVAVALNLVAAGLGTDTGGSVRIPPALNGVVGFRPSMGRYPADGLVSISTTRDTVGPITRTVAGAALVDAVLSDTAAELSAAALDGLRLGVPRSYFYDNLDPDVASVMSAVLEKLTAAGVILVEADIENLAELNELVSFPVVLYETAQTLPQYLADNAPSISVEQLLESIASPDVKAVVGDALGGAIPEEVYQQALQVHRPALQDAYRQYFALHRVEAVIFPTTALPARPIANSLETIDWNGEQQPTFPSYIRNTDPASNAGIPALTIPAGLSSQGLPIGLEIDGPAGSDRRVLSIGLALETLLQQQQTAL